MNLNADRKRMWFEDLKNINDGIMIDSMPISMNHFEKHFVFMPRDHIYFIECPRDAKLSHEVG